VATYRLDSAVSFLKKYARRARLDVVAAGIQRMLQEILIKQERNAWVTLLVALAQAQNFGKNHTITATTQNVLQIDDFNRWLTLAKRINSAWTGGTPEAREGRGVTDVFMSPEMTEQMRGFVYQPMNTRSGAVSSSGATSVALPDAVRQEIFNNTGTPTLYDIGIHELLELGTSQKYNNIFAQYATAGISFGAANFSATTDEILVGVDLVAGGFYRPLARNADSGSTFTAQPDDSFPTRAEKMGFYGSLEEGRVVVRAKSLTGLLV
jgi:hypothetical protein